MNIEKVSETDTRELLEIYAPYVTDTAVSFEYTVPSEEEFRDRILRISARFPYLKAVDDAGKILGYAYASAFHERKAYDWSVETTVYVRRDCRRRGVGRQLYETLEASLRDMGVLNMNACIAVPVQEDAYLTMDSVHFHEKMGFQPVGTFHGSGYKFETWYDMIWMEKLLGGHNKAPEPVQFGNWKL